VVVVSGKSGDEIRSLKTFFHDRACSIQGRTDRELCFVSGRDPRLWEDGSLYRDLLDSIRSQLDVKEDTVLIEIGCAAGFLARGLSSLCGRYVGVDVAPGAVRVARSMGIPNAMFRVADATALPFADEHFDRSISYDVFTNFPGFDYASRVMAEMVRTTKRGGKIMIGSLADASRSAEYEERCREVAGELDARYGRLEDPADGKDPWNSIRKWMRSRLRRAEPKITCYSFNRDDFIRFGRERSLKTEVFEIHGLNPYRGMRFNVVYTKAP
jgi:ubiquinone/menaquinone biosynthesis C-methylase UbiE